MTWTDYKEQEALYQQYLRFKSDVDFCRRAREYLPRLSWPRLLNWLREARATYRLHDIPDHIIRNRPVPPPPVRSTPPSPPSSSAQLKAGELVIPNYLIGPYDDKFKSNAEKQKLKRTCGCGKTVDYYGSHSHIQSFPMDFEAQRLKEKWLQTHSRPMSVTSAYTPSVRLSTTVPEVGYYNANNPPAILDTKATCSACHESFEYSVDKLRKHEIDCGPAGYSTQKTQVPLPEKSPWQTSS